MQHYQLLKLKAGTFVDVGANLGQTLLKVKAIDRKQSYVGFEPNPGCCYYLDRLIQVNRLENCRLLPIGLAQTAEVLRLFIRNSTDDSASLVEGFRESDFYNSEIFVSVFPGDRLVEQMELESVSVLKIDTEGGELEVIQGLRQTILKFRPFILCEVLPIHDQTTEQGQFRKARQDTLEQFLKAADYCMVRIHHDGTLVALDTIEIHSDLALCEYLFCPRESQGLINASLEGV